MYSQDLMLHDYKRQARKATKDRYKAQCMACLPDNTAIGDDDRLDRNIAGLGGVGLDLLDCKRTGNISQSC